MPRVSDSDTVPRHTCCLLLALALFSCTVDRTQNPWLNPRSSEVAAERWQQLPDARFREVTGEARAEAVRMLESEPAQRIPGRDVHRFVAAGALDQPSGRFYLLRAVRTNQNSTCEVLVRGRAVTVRCTGAPSGASVQTAVIADLEQPPERLYVEFSAAE